MDDLAAKATQREDLEPNPSSGKGCELPQKIGVHMAWELRHNEGDAIVPESCCGRRRGDGWVLEGGSHQTIVEPLRRCHHGIDGEVLISQYFGPLPHRFC